jgi:hypothetical protein
MNKNPGPQEASSDRHVAESDSNSINQAEDLNLLDNAINFGEHGTITPTRFCFYLK